VKKNTVQNSAMHKVHSNSTNVKITKAKKLNLNKMYKSMFYSVSPRNVT